MKKYENFCRCLDTLKGSDRDMAAANEIYRTGVIGQFNLTFELAWKLLQEVLRAYSVSQAQSGSPREIIKLGFKVNFIDNEQAWIAMQRDRNSSVHIYNEEDINEIVKRIFDIYIPLFVDFERKMSERIRAVDEGE